MTFEPSTYVYDSLAGLGNPRKYPTLKLDIRPAALTAAEAAKARMQDLIHQPQDSLAGLGGGLRALENFAMRKDGVPKRGETVQIRVDGVRRPVTILTVEELRDGSGVNINGTLPDGARVGGFLDLETMTLVEEKPGDGRNKAAKSGDDGTLTKFTRFKVGDRVRIHTHAESRVVTLDKIEPSTKGNLYVEASWAGGSTSGFFSPTQLSAPV